MIPPAQGLHSRQTHGDWKQNGGCQGLAAEGMEGQCSRGAVLQVGKTRMFSRWLVVMGAPQREIYLQHWTLPQGSLRAKKRLEETHESALESKERHSQTGGLHGSTWSQLGDKAVSEAFLTHWLSDSRGFHTRSLLPEKGRVFGEYAFCTILCTYVGPKLSLTGSWITWLLRSLGFWEMLSV